MRAEFYYSTSSHFERCEQQPTKQPTKTVRAASCALRATTGGARLSCQGLTNAQARPRVSSRADGCSSQHGPKWLTVAGSLLHSGMSRRASEAFRYSALEFLRSGGGIPAVTRYRREIRGALQSFHPTLQTVVTALNLIAIQLGPR